MSQSITRQIIELIRKAAELAESIGIENLVQPGLIKEMIIADILGHQSILFKGLTYNSAKLSLQATKAL